MNAAERKLMIGDPRKIGETDVADWVRFSADGSTIVYVEEKTMGRAVRVSDLSDRAHPFVLNSFPDNLAVSRKGDSIAVSSVRRGFSLYHLIGDEFERALFGEEGNTFKTFAFLPNDREVLLNDPTEISIWDIDKSKKVASLAKEKAEFPGKVSIGEKASFAAIQTPGSGTKVLSVPTLEVLFEHVHPSGPGDPKLSPCGRYLALHWGNGRVELWNLQLMRQKLNEIGSDWKEPGFGQVDPMFEVEPEKVIVSGKLLPE